mgnify:CR=1 FL=1
MRFQNFQDYVKGREIVESNGLNRTAMQYDRRLAQFNSRFNDPAEGESVIKAAGYKNVGAFLADPDDRKWNKLRIPGQQNYL